MIQATMQEDMTNEWLLSENTVAVRVTLREDGPIVVEGLVTLVSAKRSGDHNKMFLCRCGLSADKPLCDGAHKRNTFKAEGISPVRTLKNQ